MSDNELSFAATNRIGVEFVLAELDAAPTFMDIAATSGIEERYAAITKTPARHTTPLYACCNT